MIRVLLAEDVRVLRDALTALLNLEPDIDVVAAVARGDKVLDAAVTHTVDVAVMDIDMPGLDGLDAAARVHRQLPTCRTLILTGLGNPANLRRAARAPTSTVHSQGHAPPRCRRCDPHGRRGWSCRRPAVGVFDARYRPQSPHRAGSGCAATDAGGATPREVATSLHLSYGTVRNYLASSVTKLNARNRVDAIRIAAEAGWI